MDTSLLVPARDGRGDYEDRGSRFHGFAFRVPDEAGFAARLGELRREHSRARHHCWAWRLPGAHRFHDDGEPGGTAGRPILQVLEGAGLVHAGVVVVRYFGGVKLGTGGLVRAYTGAAQRALAAAGSREQAVRVAVRLFLPFDLTGLRTELERACPSLTWGEGGFRAGGWEGRVSMDASDSARFRLLVAERGGGRARVAEAGT